VSCPLLIVATSILARTVIFVAVSSMASALVLLVRRVVVAFDLPAPAPLAILVFSARLLTFSHNTQPATNSSNKLV